MSNKVIVYHGDNCHDGITSLWCALQSKEWAGAEPYRGEYYTPPNYTLLRRKDVLIVDFSWKRPEMCFLAGACQSLTVIDHHKTAEEDLKSLPGATVIFDKERSGAGLVWDTLIGGSRPRLVDYVEDRDLWKFKLLGCREVHACCDSFPVTLEAREELMKWPIEDLMKEGTPILRYERRLIESIASKATMINIDGHEVPGVACPLKQLASEVGNILAKGHAFSATWSDKEDGSRSYSLRSDWAPDGSKGLDVSKIAERLGGGGGHAGAAGFRTVNQ